MPDVLSHEESQTLHPIPTTRREASMLLTLIGHLLIRIKRTRARYDKRISRLQKKLTALTEERDALVSADLGESALFARNLTEYALSAWDTLVERGLRTIKLGTGEVRRREVGVPTIIIPDAAAFQDEARRKGMLKRLGAWSWKPNLKKIQNDLSLVAHFRSIKIVYDEKIELRPARGDLRLEASMAQEEREFYIPEPPKRTRA